MDSLSPTISTENLKPCIHTKNIFSMFDLFESDEAYTKIRRHVDTCKTCEAAYKKFELENLEVKIYIPKPQIDSETKAVFESEVSEIFKNFDLNEKALLRKKLKTKIKNIDTAGTDFLKNLGSRRMLTTYAFGVALFVILRHFF